MIIKDVVGLGFAIIGLAALSVMILNGGDTANVFGALAGGFSNVISTATHPGQAQH